MLDRVEQALKQSAEVLAAGRTIKLLQKRLMELTERERRWPFIFLWPKVFNFFRERSRWEVRR